MPISRIVTRIYGGIGNQLFIYAASRRFAIKENAELYIDDSTGFKEDFQYRREFALDHFTAVYRPATPRQRLEPFSKVRRKLARMIGATLSSSVNGYVYNPHVDYRRGYDKLPDRKQVHLEGYWQSYRYFSDVQEQLQRELTIIPPDDDTNRALAERIHNAPSTAVHLRFFDSNIDRHWDAWEGYYRRAARIASQRNPTAHSYIFSDHPDRARVVAEKIWGQNFTLILNNDTKDSAFADMWLISQCNSVIMADSTFSWWAAWFNTSPDKLIIAPRRSLSGRDFAWNTDALIPKEWVLV